MPPPPLLRRRPALVLGVAAGLPLLVAAIVLAFRPWTPVLDLAMTELRVRDVGGRHTPLVGLPGRIGVFPDQGSHPGPWSFVLLAPAYRIAGGTAWGLELGSIVVNVSAVLTLTALGARRFGWRGAVCFAALGAVAVRGYGLNVLTHPWNPYFPVLWWLVAVIAAWMVLDGRAVLAPLVAAATVVAAQTHVPYLVGAVALNVAVVAALLVRWRREQVSLRPLWWMLGVVGALWLPPLVEQLRYGDDGNVAKLVRHFGTQQDEPAIGFRAALGLVSQHLDLVSIARDLVLHDDALLRRAGTIEQGWNLVGLLVLAGWCASVAVAIRRRHRTLLALHAVVATTLAAGTIAIARIFGKVWFYLTLWMSATAMLMAIGLVWTVWLVVRDRRPDVDRRAVPVVAAAVGILATLASLLAVPGQRVPEDAAVVRELLPVVEPQLDRSESYVVFWEEAIVPGSLGYALLNELEGDGFAVGVHPTWRIPATRHRVRFEGDYGAEIHIVTGAFIDGWRERPDHREIAFLDRRTPEERERFAALRSRVIRRLGELGRDDLVPGVDENVFRTSLVPGLPGDVVDDLDAMLRLGDPVAVFLAPAGSTS